MATFKFDTMIPFKGPALLLAFATGVGAFSIMPQPPQVLRELGKNKIVQWAMLFVMLWQGGAAQDVKLAAFVTAAMFAIYQVLPMMSAKCGEKTDQ